MQLDTVTAFVGEYRFLSNFWRIAIEYRERTYPSVEHAYQAAKVDLNVPNYDELCREIRTACTPGQAKRLGRHVPMRPDWDIDKLFVMRMLLIRKFDDPSLRKLLIDTSPAVLIEGNSWNDQYWGVCNGQGQNHLGQLLMGIRGDHVAAAKA